MISLFLLFTIFGVEPVEAKVITENNIKYVCLLPGPAQDLLELRLSYPLLQKQVLKYEELLAVNAVENDRLGQSISDLSNQLDAQNQVINILQLAVKEPTPWYKQPSFWAVTGILLGVGVTVLLYESIENENDRIATTTTP